MSNADQVAEVRTTATVTDRRSGLKRTGSAGGSAIRMTPVLAMHRDLVPTHARQPQQLPQFGHVNLPVDYRS